MIYVNFIGRCGNQFFQYSFFRKIQLGINDNQMPVFNFYDVFRWQKKTGDASFSDCLHFFNTIKYKALSEEGNGIQKYGTKKQKRIFSTYKFYYKLSGKTKISLFARLYHRKMQRNGIYFEDKYFSLFCYPKTKNIFIKGYFENRQYYVGLEKKLKKELSSNASKSYANDYFKRTKQCNLVCFSIRVWNEISNDKDLLRSRDICTRDYYQQAMNTMKKIVDKPVFVVFSNDIEWVKNNVDFGNNSVLFEPQGLNVDQKIALMTYCRHYIISPSTFSWWAQYLGKKEGSIIVSPNKWYSDKKDELLENDWIKIAV